MGKFKKGDIVEHKLNKEWLMVLEVRGADIECRTKSLEVRTFQEFELKERN